MWRVYRPYDDISLNLPGAFDDPRDPSRLRQSNPALAMIGRELLSAAMAIPIDNILFASEME